MPVTMKELGIEKLSTRERIELAQEIWDSVAEDELPPLDDAQRREVDRRLAAHEANPTAAVPWEQVEAAALARLQK